MATFEFISGWINPASVLAAISAIMGFCLKSLWDWFIRLSDDKRKKRLDFLERQLSQFYWPIYLQLQKNNVVWDQLVNGKSFNDQVKLDVDRYLNKNFFKQNNMLIMGLIESNMHLIQPTEKLRAAILQFVRHVALYATLRDIGYDDVDPIALDVPWPEDLFVEIESALFDKQSEFNGMVSSK